MFHLKRRSRSADNRAFADALNVSLGIIEFDLSGNILTANANFCSVVGYDLSELQGKHHRMFVRAAEANASEYKAFWEKLANGQFDSGEYHRVAKGGRDIWIQATYNPVKDAKGVPYKVVKVAADVTAQKEAKIETDGKLAAISRAQAVIEFTPGGDIITANDNFLAALGYNLNEVAGRHHRMFVDATYAQSADYRDFWARLNRGEFVSSEFMRIGKGGKEVWIQATYNPVFDLRGTVTKVVKYATEVTGRVQAVQGISAGLTQLADNNLEYRLDRAFVGSFEKLRADYNGSLNVLQSSMQRIASNAISIQSGANEIASASDELSRRTEQQAANLEETAAALDSITATVRKSAAHATHARSVVGSANDHAIRSAATVRKAIGAMETIAKSSQQINQIIGVIDEIAFQTNLLALNAGVEAARAGEAGRGFAVVASEVRALAQRSAEAAKEIKALLSASSSQVDEGVKLVVETGASLEQILAQVTEIKEVVVDIAAGAEEQANGLAEINTAVGQLDQVTQQNAAMSEEATAASQTLSVQAIELGNLVGGFRVGGVATQAAVNSRQKISTNSAAPRIASTRAPVRLVANGHPQNGHPQSDAAGWDEF